MLKPAARASLARLVLAGVQNNQLAPSLFRFGGEHLQQGSRSGARMERFRPAFCRTFLPGSSTLLRAEAVMFRAASSSVTISRSIPQTRSSHGACAALG